MTPRGWFGALREPMLLLGVYTALTLWCVWPLPTVLATDSAIARDSILRPDLRMIVWALAWDAHALVTQPGRLFQANAFYPAPLSLAFSDHALGYMPFFAPVYWLTGNPVLSLNVTALATFPLCGLAAYLLARRFVGGPGAALAGFFFAFVPARLAELGHPHLLGVQYLPLVMLATERWFDGARPTDMVLLTMAMVLQALSSIYLAFALALAYGVYLPLALWRRRARLDARRLVGLGLGIGVAAAVVLAVNLPYFVLRRMGLFPSYGEGEPLALGLAYAPMLARDVLGAKNVGPLGYALAAAAILPPWRRGGGFAVLGVALLIAGAVAAFGPTFVVAGHKLWTPYGFLAAWIPGLATIRVPVRFTVVAQLGMAVLAGAGASRILGRVPGVLRWPAAALTAVLALGAMGELPAIALEHEPVGPTVPPAYRWLADHGEGGALLELPQAHEFESARRMYLSTFHWLPIVDGYSGYPPGTAAYIHGLARGLPAEDALQALVDAADIGWVLVHREQFFDPTPWRRALPAGLERVAEWQDDLLLRVTRGVAHDLRDRLLSTRETLGGVPLVPVGPRCPGTLRLAAARPQPWPPFAVAHVEVAVQNGGTRPWPAVGLVPRHLVRLRACMARPGERCLATPVSLPRDLVPGERVAVGVDLPAPWLQGEYEIDVRLVQTGDGDLERCGVAPLRVPVRVGAAPPTQPPDRRRENSES